MSLVFHERDQEDEPGPASKRAKIDDGADKEHILPPSHSLLGIPLPVATNGPMNFVEADVGISEYIGQGISKIEGIIKQRFTDFLVHEIDQDGNVVHLKSLEKPQAPKGEATSAATVSTDVVMEDGEKTTDKPADKGKAKTADEPWPEHFNTRLSEFLSEDAILKLKEMYLEGPEPPRVSDSGWGSRPAPGTASTEPAAEPELEKRGKDRGGHGGRGGRGGRGGGRGGRPAAREDHRKVLSNPIQSKDIRTSLHVAVRELFGGKLESEADASHTGPAPEEGTRIAIKWGSRGRGGRGGGGGGGTRTPRGTYPPYIHFTLQKTNRDTQDALGHLSRILHVSIKDLSVAGTKDKRGITVQRVALKRNNKTIEDIWKLANAQVGRQSHNNGAVNQRGDRGVRIGDFNYRKASLELGMLKGNAFIITLRSVQVDSMETLNKALEVVKTKGFINYYGMQRFGTASVPTHSIGLALLKSEWQKAVSMILRKRHGEHPDVEAARDAWLVDGDLDKALELMPRRVVAERCILESFQKQKGETRNAMGALSTIPRNLRLMYVHAYQSYVWNAIVSERIRTYGAERPIVGDLVFDTTPEEDVSMPDALDGEAPPVEDDKEIPAAEDEKEAPEDPSLSRSRQRSKRPWVAPKIKTLTEEDLDKYTIFDVLMPLPGTDVAYPGGPLGEKYKEYLRVDGLDPDNFVRKQKEYTLNGSYRAILHLPKELSWSVLRYTDPDVALAQADEDKLLGYDPPVISDDGRFMALQIKLALGTAAYATMALREITKIDTSSHHQATLTTLAEDQKYRGTEGGPMAGDGLEAETNPENEEVA
ncbi:pseudouridine synthase [Mycena metata]|uniref:Pseudouridine synthase n=1 Tax=Mycena metata TaxID=1033252 RepID=A0AAD7K9I1_9AGAR|nr:pseudouridine synthase [Mycena metata]